MYSVVMAVHNGEHFVIEALESVFKQTVPPDEVIVVDDSSDDRTRELLVSMKSDFAILDCQSKNQASALNVGLLHTRSQFVAFLDHDDLWLPNKQEEQLNTLLEAKVDCVSGGVSNFVSKDSFVYLGPSRVFGATTFRSELFSRVGLLNEDIRHHSIFEWWSRASFQGVSHRTIDKTHLLRRIHANNSGIAHKSEARRAMIDEVRSHLGRKS